MFISRASPFHYVSANPIGILVANLLVPSVVNQQSDIPTVVSIIRIKHECEGGIEKSSQGPPFGITRPSE